MKIYIVSIFLFMGALSFLVSSCNDDDPAIENPEELITTVNFTLSPPVGDDIILSFVDLDGDGGSPPTITGDTLTANTTYSGSIELLNETENPVEDITLEVADEATEHQLFYSSQDVNVTFNYSDMDVDSNPIGILTSVTTTSDTGSGSITIILRHEPEKFASGVSNGDITNAGGETDIEVTIPIFIE